MPTNKTRTLITLTFEELTNLKGEAAENEKSLNNLLRGKIGLPELKRGAEIGNKRASARAMEKQGNDITF